MTIDWFQDNRNEKKNKDKDDEQILQSLQQRSQLQQDSLLSSAKNMSQSVLDIGQIIKHVQGRYLKNEKIQERLHLTLTFLQILSDLLRQLILILEENVDEEYYRIRRVYKDQEEFYIRAESRYEVNQVAANHIIKILNDDILNQFIRLGNTYIIGHTKSANKLQGDLKIYNSHLTLIVRCVASAIDMDQNDLMCLPKENNLWLEIASVTTHQQLSLNPQQIQQSYYRFMKSIRVGHAVFLRSSQYQSFPKYIIFVLSALWYFLFDGRAKNRAFQHICDMRIDSCMGVMNLIEQPGIKHLIKLGISPIKVNMKIYIDPVVTPITLQRIQQWDQEGTINNITLDQIEQVNQETHSEFTLLTKNKSKLRIRILCSQDLQFNYKYTDKFFECVIIHIHGGGFISMSSGSHQNYTREWANNLNIPIFSIDYSLAPKYKYPHAIDDCWQAYHWVLQYMSKFFNILPKRIVLAGDSAGGNLCCAITSLAIKHGVRIPDGMFLAYPVMDLKMKYSPSHAYGLNDYLLSHTVMDLCIKAYTVGSDKDPFRSPAFLSDEILSKYPPCRVVVGTIDPLLDHSYRFVSQMLRNNRDVKLTVYDGMSHGFLNFYLLGGMKETQQCIIDSIFYLKELLYVKK